MTVVSEMSRQIAYLPYQRAFRAPLRTAHGAWSVRQGFIVRVEMPDRVGYGEVAPIPDFGTETVGAAEAFLRELVEDPDLTVPADLPCCEFAVSSAAAGVAPSQLYAVSGLLPAGFSALAVLERKAELGYENFKWKIGVEPVATELSVLRQLLSKLPEGGRLRLDANASLGVDTLEQWLAALAPCGNQIDYLEQPLAVGEERLMADYMASSGVSIALDESLNGANGARWLQAWQGPLVVKPLLMGNFAKLLGRLQPVSDRVILSSVFETGFGLANALQLADQIGANKRAIGFDTLGAFDDALQPLRSAPRLQLEQSHISQIEQLWQTSLHSK
jgi:O-succinylbenzoate synthase